MSRHDDRSEKLKQDLQLFPADGVRTVARTALGMVPFGSPAVELLNLVFAEPLSGRRDRWLESLYKDLLDLQERTEGFDINKLGENEQFVTAATNAMQSALRTHQEVKRAALRNAVLNSALGSQLSDDVQLIFLAYIDDLTPSHLDILQFARHPKRWLELNGSPFPVLENALPNQITLSDFNHFRHKALAKYRADDLIYKLLIEDLMRRNFIESDPFQRVQDTMSPQRMELSYVTTLGRDFLSYISAPD